MSYDPIIDEIRKIRREIEAECQNDAGKYYEHLMDIQKKYGKQLVRRGPRPRLQVKKPGMEAISIA